MKLSKQGILVLFFSLVLIISGVLAINNNVFAKDKAGAFIGIYPSDLDDDEREALDYKGKNGILVEDIVEDGPAQKSGLEAGDIIVEIAQKDIDSVKKLRKVLAKQSEGDLVNVIVFRDGKERKFDVVLGGPKEKIFNLQFSENGKGGYLGVYTITLVGQLAEYFKVDHGVLIKEVAPDTPAAKAKLKAGDVIVKINDTEIMDKSGLTSTLWSYKPEEEVTIYYKSDGKNKDVKVVLGEADFGDRFDHVIREINVHDFGATIGDMLQDLKIETYDEESENELKEEFEQMRKELKEIKKELDEQKKMIDKKK